MKILLLGTAMVAAALAMVALLRYMTAVPGRPHSGPLPALTAEEKSLARRLGAHIAAIASRPHNVRHYAELEQVARYIERELAALGYAPFAQVYNVDGRDVRNIEVVVEPGDPGRLRGTLVLGAHYDSFDEAPGANDNGTGTAVILELARMLGDLRGRTDVRIRLVLFVNEEPPYYRTAGMGSYRYVRALAERGERVIGMISLETLGCFFEAPGTQHYPMPFGLVFPSEANFIAFVGVMRSRSREFLHAVIQSFRRHTAFPTIGGVAPGFVPGIDWSDHWSFEQFRYPALMITDTALYRYPHYHRPTDTPDKVDVEKLARIARGLDRVIRDVAAPGWPTPAVGPRG